MEAFLLGMTYGFISTKLGYPFTTWQHWVGLVLLVFVYSSLRS